jgi:flagellar motor switch protein FliN/FliY
MTLQASATVIDLDALLSAAGAVASHLSALGELDARVLSAQERSGHQLDGGIALSVSCNGGSRGHVGLVAGLDAAAAMAGQGDVLEGWEPVMASLVVALTDRAGDLEPQDLHVLAVGAGNGPALDPSAISVGLFRDQDMLAAIGFLTEQAADAAQVAGVEQAAAAEKVSGVEQVAAAEREGAGQVAGAEQIFHELVGGDTAAVEVRRMRLLRDVEMGVSVELGRTRMTVRDLLALAPGTIVELDKAAGSPVDVLVNGTLMARGEVVVIDEEFAVRISEIVTPEQDSRLGA